MWLAGRLPYWCEGSIEALGTTVVEVIIAYCICALTVDLYGAYNDRVADIGERRYWQMQYKEGTRNKAARPAVGFLADELLLAMPVVAFRSSYIRLSLFFWVFLLSPAYDEDRMSKKMHVPMQLVNGCKFTSSRTFPLSLQSPLSSLLNQSLLPLNSSSTLLSLPIKDVIF